MWWFAWQGDKPGDSGDVVSCLVSCLYLKTSSRELIVASVRDVLDAVKAEGRLLWLQGMLRAKMTEGAADVGLVVRMEDVPVSEVTEVVWGAESLFRECLGMPGGCLCTGTLMWLCAKTDAWVAMEAMSADRVAWMSAVVAHFA